MPGSQPPTGRILVVEDDPDFAALLETMLRDAGFGVMIARDGAEALDRVSRSIPAAITLDIVMPKKTGLMFYRQLKSRYPYRSIPVIVITGMTRDDPEMSTFIRSFLEPEHLPVPQAYLEKPVSRERLVGMIRSLVAGARSA